jgi:hypothetical protein
MKKTIDTTLDRDPAYVEASERYLALKVELSNLEKQRTEILTGLSSLTNSRKQAIQDQAAALLSGAELDAGKVARRDSMIRNLEELTDRIAVLREAETMQRAIVANERTRVSREICAELAPRHAANVAAVARAALALAEAVAAEAALRGELEANGVEFAGYLRAMPINGFKIDDSQSRLSRYLLECHEYGFLEASDLPAVVRKYIPPKAKPAAVVKAAPAAVDGWQ